MKKIVAIIQARLGSTRLPGKILLDLMPGRPALDCMLERAQRSRLITDIVVATTENPNDAPLVSWLKEHGHKYFVGSENDVLDRYFQTAKSLALAPDDVIVRLTSDCPVIDPNIVDEVIQFYLDGDFDYAANGLEPYTYADGMDTEVFSFAALERAQREVTKEAHREHVTFYFWKNPEKFKIGYYVNKESGAAGYRLTLDYPEDYELLQAVYAGLYGKNSAFTMNEIADFLETHLDIKNLNSRFARNVSWQAA